MGKRLCRTDRSDTSARTPGQIVIDQKFDRLEAIAEAPHRRIDRLAKIVTARAEQQRIFAEEQKELSQQIQALLRTALAQQDSLEAMRRQREQQQQYEQWQAEYRQEMEEYRRAMETQRRHHEQLEAEYRQHTAETDERFNVLLEEVRYLIRRLNTPQEPTDDRSI